MLKNKVAVASSILTLLVSGLAQAEDLSTYRSYLGPECHESRYADHSFRGSAVTQGVAGGVEAYVAADTLHAISHAQLHRKFTVPSLILLGDGVGRLLGGSCAGITGLDDVLVAPLATGFDAVVKPLGKKIAGSKSVTDAKTKVLPAAPEAGAEAFRGPLAQSRTAR